MLKIQALGWRFAWHPCSSSPPLQHKKKHHRQQECHVQRGACPVRTTTSGEGCRSWNSSFQLGGMEVPSPGHPGSGDSPTSLGLVMELIPGLHLPVRTRSWWAISGGNRVARIFDCSRSKSDFNRRRFS